MANRFAVRYPWNIIGHRRQLEQLEGDLEGGRLSHAYLFSGPKQVGKFSVARRFAGMIQCPQGFCQACDTCRRVQAGNHPDVMILEDDGGSLKIDQVREMNRTISLTSQGAKRVVVIQNVERMPVEAQNAFLKTVEEPPGDTIFLLTASQPDQVLPTIRSRARHYALSTVGDSEMRTHLRQTFGQRPEIDEAVGMAQGRPGLAIALMENTEAFSHQRGLYLQIEGFLKKNDLSQKFAFVETIEKNADEVERFLDTFTRYLRKLILDYTRLPAHPLKNRFTLRGLVNLFDVLEKTRYFIKRNVNKRLALENLLIQTEISK